MHRRNAKGRNGRSAREHVAVCLTSVPNCVCVFVYYCASRSKVRSLPGNLFESRLMELIDSLTEDSGPSLLFPSPFQLRSPFLTSHLFPHHFYHIISPLTTLSCSHLSSLFHAVHFREGFIKPSWIHLHLLPLLNLRCVCFL